MKHLLFIAILLASLSSYAQGYGTRELPNPKVVQPPMERYDTTSMYLNPSKLSQNIHYYDGQRIFFLQQKIYTDRPFTAMTAFYVSDTTEFLRLADTTWHKRRKNPRPEDYTVVIPKTNVYRAAYYKEVPVFRFERLLKKYQSALLHQWSGFFTPCDVIEGKEFRIDRVSFLKKVQDGSVVGDKFRFHLIDDMGCELSMDLENPSYGEHNFLPILMCACYEQYTSMIGKSFVAKDISYRKPVLQRTSDRRYKQIMGDLTITGTAFLAGYHSVYVTDLRQSISYYTPILFLTDKSGDELMMRIDYDENPDIWNRSISYENVIDGGSWDNHYYHILFPELMSAEEHYAELERKRLKEEAMRLAQEQADKERETRIRKTYSPAIAKLILEGKVRIGMTKAMCREAWGEPNDINKTSGSWGVHEQWIYGMGCYLYFDNGKLTSIQN